MSVKTAARTLDLFEHFSRLQEPTTLSELAAAMAIPISSCFALVRTLEERGYVYMLGGHKQLYPTKRILEVAQRIAERDPVLKLVRPAMETLGRETHETIVFSHRNGDRVVYLDVFQSTNSVRYHAEVGDSKALYASSTGKAFLGAMSDEEFEAIVPHLSFKALTPYTITTVEALKGDIALSRRRGWYCNLRESVEDLAGVSVSLDLTGERYCISVVGPVYRLQPNLDMIGATLQAVRLSLGAGKN